uniref:Retrotransposon protein, putative, unclassified n=1 Tax=Oryza sativa subsp. japonica TaxID=39947 RepID=Q2QT12_ORYSJ|nr:retrotransposon protein, putative, unclassified [Oryza sativa Japonica Group]
MADLDQSSSGAAMLKKLYTEGAVPPKQIMAREAGGTNPSPILGRMVAVDDFIRCGFLPPPSEFLLLVLNFYGLSLLHLNPNSIAFLSIFAHLYEAYIGVVHFLDLFRFFYELRWMEANRVSGCCGFRVRDGMKAKYIPLQCHTSWSQWRSRWFYLEQKELDLVLVVPEVRPERFEDWTSKPPLTPSLETFVDVVSDLHERGLTGYEVVEDFVSRRIQPLQARAHPAFDYTGAEDVTRISSPFCQHHDARVKEVLISAASTADEPPAPLCDKSAVEKAAAINASASLKEKVADKVTNISSIPAIAGGSGTKRKPWRLEWGHDLLSYAGHGQSGPPPKRRTLKLPAGKKASAISAQSGSEAATSGSPAAVIPRVEMKEIVAGNEMQRQGMEKKMNDTQEILFSLHDSLRKSFTNLHRLALSCGVESSIPTHLDETSLTSALSELPGEMEAIPSWHTAHIADEISNGIHTGACHLLACVKLALPSVDLKEILSKGAADATREDVMSSAEDVQQGGCPDLAMINLPSSSDMPFPNIFKDGERWRPLHALPFVDLDGAIAEQDRRIAYWRMKFKVAELERSLLVVKKNQDVEALQGREVWLNSYLKSCCNAMVGVCH